MQFIKSIIPIKLKVTLKRLLAHDDFADRMRLLQRLPKKSIGAEIGVDKGDFSAHILRELHPQKLHLLDPWEFVKSEQYEASRYGGANMSQAIMDERFQQVQTRFAKNTAQAQVIFHRGYSSAIAQDFQDAYFDWVYIDGNHLYDFVKQDLTLYFPKIKSGGFILGDDYGIVGWWENGVKRAVDEFVQSHQLRLEIIGKSQFLIRKP